MMFDDQDNIFNIPHSLPSSSHMTAVATRTPSGDQKIETNKYMPDYGGIIEVPGTKTKRSGIRVGIPFDTNPYYVRVVSDSEQSQSLEPKGSDCLIATPYLNLNSDDLYQSESSFSTIRAVGKTLYLDLVKSIPCQPTAPDIHYFSTYSYVPYSYKISGLKYCDNIDNYVIVKFAQGIKLIKLNSFYRIPAEVPCTQNNHGCDPEETEVDECDTVSLPDQSAVNSIDSFAEKQGIQVKDASLSRSQSWLYIASSDCQDFYVKLYDLSTSKQCYNILSKTRDDDVKIRMEESKRHSADRKRSLRSFIPSKPTFEELQQIVCDPSHLVNSLMITSNRVALVDPRQSTIAMDYADKFRMLSISPNERFKQIEFSHFNDQQFYLMSSEKLRALDKRYPSKDMNILNHMINSTAYDIMTMKLAASKRTEQETLCLSAYGHICIFSFDQSHYTHSLLASPGNLVNPRSMHNPIHEPSPTTISGKETDELYGLAVASDTIFDSNDILFSTLQLSQEGDVCVRGFLSPQDNFLDFGTSSTTRSMVTKKPQDSIANEKPANPDLETDNSETSMQSTAADENQLNILDADYVLEAEKLLTTKRARLKYDWMKKKLRRK